MLKFIRAYSVNFLSLLNIIFSFVFTLLFAMFYKVSHVADAYFYALIIYGNIFLVIQLFYSTFFNVYLHIQDEEKRNNLYYMVSLFLTLVSIVVVGIYFLMTSHFSILSEMVKKYLDIYIFTLIFAPIIGISIQLMNAKREFYYAYYYPIGRNIVAFSLLLIYQEQANLDYLAYGFLFYDFFFSLIIVIKAVKLLGFRTIYFDKPSFIKILQKSFLDKTGQFFLGLPELLIGNVFVSQYPSILSIYSYIKKFVTALIQFIFMPQNTVYASKIASYIHRSRYDGIKLEMKKLWFKTIPYFLVSFFILIFLIKFILVIFLSDKIVEIHSLDIYFILCTLFFQNLFLMLEYPYGAIINQKLLFEYAVKIKVMSFFSFLFFYFLFFFFFHNLYFLLVSSIIPGLILFIFFRRRSFTMIMPQNKKQKLFWNYLKKSKF